MRPLSAILIAVACAGSLTARAQIKAYGYDTPSYIEFSAPRYEVNATETNAVITLVRSGDYRKTAAVDYATKDGSAEGSVNFQPSGGTLVFAAGESFKTINIPIIREEPEPAKSFQVEITPATTETIVTTPTAEVEIQSAPPALEIAANGQNLSLSWTDIGQPFALEAKINDSWVPVSNEPTLENGGWTVQFAPTPEAPVVLFRLVAQP